MIFLKKVKPITVRMYTNNPAVFELFPPKAASELKPHWLSSKEDDARGCIGVRKMFSSGFGVPIWTDLDISTSLNANGEVDVNFSFADRKNYLLLQRNKSFLVQGSRLCLKIAPPWVAECSEDVNFVAVENMWANPNRRLDFMCGVVDFKYQSSVNMFFYIDKGNFQFQLNAGDVPIIWKHQSERKLLIEPHYDPEKFAYLDEVSQNRAFRKFNYSKRKNILTRS